MLIMKPRYDYLRMDPFELWHNQLDRKRKPDMEIVKRNGVNQVKSNIEPRTDVVKFDLHKANILMKLLFQRPE